MEEEQREGRRGKYLAEWKSSKIQKLASKIGAGQKSGQKRQAKKDEQLFPSASAPLLLLGSAWTKVSQGTPGPGGDNDDNDDNDDSAINDDSEDDNDWPQTRALGEHLTLQDDDDDNDDDDVDNDDDEVENDDNYNDDDDNDNACLQTAALGEHVTLPCRVENKQGNLQWTRSEAS